MCQCLADLERRDWKETRKEEIKEKQSSIRVSRGTFVLLPSRAKLTSPGSIYATQSCNKIVSL